MKEKLEAIKAEALAKIDSAKEMIRTISKIISKRQSDEQLSGISGGVN